jgi:ribosome maturation factor RimP
MKVDLVALLQPILNDLGYELWGCEYLSQGKYSLLRVYIDKEDGIGIEDCEIASNQISATLDVEDPIPGNYTLEVSSPGMDRQLFFPEQYQRYIGETIKMKLYKPVNKKRNITAKIIAVNDMEVVVECEKEHFNIVFSNIAKANLTV